MSKLIVINRETNKIEAEIPFSSAELELPGYVEHVQRGYEGTRWHTELVEMSARDLSTEEMVAELARRGALPSCRCGKWQTYIGAYDRDGYTLRCHGCLRAIASCTC